MSQEVVVYREDVGRRMARNQIEGLRKGGGGEAGDAGEEEMKRYVRHSIAGDGRDSLKFLPCCSSSRRSLIKAISHPYRSTYVLSCGSTTTPCGSIQCPQPSVLPILTSNTVSLTLHFLGRCSWSSPTRSRHMT